MSTLVKPTIYFTGTRILDDGSLVDVSAYHIGTQYETLGDLSYKTAPVLKFKGAVTISMGCPYELKNYAQFTQNDRTFVGELTEGVNATKAEIRYSYNGNAPTTSKSYIYMKPFVLNSNKSGSDNTKIKARVYRDGVAGEIYEVTIDIQGVNLVY
jgi:hypothetical protein